MSEGGFARYGPTIRVEGGIRAQSTRGAIGESWWSKRFLAVLESFALGSRLTRGRNYARKGQVLSLAIAPGQVTAVVQGSRPKPYQVTVGLPILDDATWRAVEAALAEQAIFGARLLAGEMPAEIEDVFASAGADLFPTGVRQLAMRCSCPDWQVPCKHLAATFYLLAEAFDADPFEILHWRGRGREPLLARLRELRSGESTATLPTATRRRAAAKKRTRATQPTGPASGPASGAASGKAVEPAIGAAAALAEITSPELADVLERFWVSPVPLPGRPPTLDTDVDLLLRQLAQPPAAIGGPALTEHLHTLYTHLPPNAPT